MGMQRHRREVTLWCAKNDGMNYETRKRATANVRAMTKDDDDK